MTHAWTGHGHSCCGQPGPSLDTRPSLIARCGGPALCRTCALDAARIHTPVAPEPLTAKALSVAAAFGVDPPELLIWHTEVEHHTDPEQPAYAKTLDVAARCLTDDAWARQRHGLASVALVAAARFQQPLRRLR